MLRRLKRTFWIVLWVSWTLAGMGLYRELPRDLGPASAKCAPEKFSSPIGFIGDSNLVAVQRSDESSRWYIDVRDAENGTLVQTRCRDDSVNGTWFILDTRKRPVVLMQRHVQTSPAPAQNPFMTFHLYCLDLVTGAMKRITPKATGAYSVHPSKPRIAALEVFPSAKPVWHARIAVVDWETRETTVVREFPDRGSLMGMHFIAEGDRLLLAWLQPHEDRGKRDRNVLELWRLGKTPTLERTFVDIPTAQASCVSANGRVVYNNPIGTLAFEVYDVIRDRKLFASHPENAKPTTPTWGTTSPTPQLSKSGKRVLGGVPPTLWDVDTGAVVWMGHSDTYHFLDNETFVEVEHWERFWNRWNTTFVYHTSALRDLETGALRHRIVIDENTSPPKIWNAARTLAVSPGGNVYRWPPPVDWALLGACQAVLATPIVLLWWFGRWRRKLRMARRT